MFQCTIVGNRVNCGLIFKIISATDKICNSLH